jgi:tetratricopeptide (TPR) repeat protein
MSTDQDNNTQGKISRSKVFLILGVVLLMVMGLVWSLDDSLVYASFGLGSWFLFLSYWNRPIADSGNNFRAGKSSGNENLFDGLRNIFTSQASGRPGQTNRSPSEIQQQKSKFAAFAFVFFFVVIFIVVVSVVTIFSDEDSDESVSSYDRAEQFRSDNELDSAKVYFAKALRDDPTKAEAPMGYGNVFLSEENYDSALFWFEKALEVNNEYEDARYNKALALYYQKRYDTSRDELLRILKNNAEYYEADVLMGDNFYAQENYDHAIGWYEKGYAGGFRSAGLCHIMAYLYDLKSQPDKAIKLYQEALSYDSTRTQIYTRLAELIPEKSAIYNDLARKYSN